MTFPPLHGREFGGKSLETGLEWVGKFFFLPTSNHWMFVYLDEKDNPVEVLKGIATTPRDAFEECVAKFIYLNEGAESPTLKSLLPYLRGCFNDEGGVRLEYF